MLFPILVATAWSCADRLADRHACLVDTRIVADTEHDCDILLPLAEHIDMVGSGDHLLRCQFGLGRSHAALRAAASIDCTLTPSLRASTSSTALLLCWNARLFMLA